MPRYVVERVAEALNSRSRAVRGSRVHLFGMAYKPDVSDVRESPALDVAELLLRRGAEVTYSDPFVPGGPGRGPCRWMPSPPSGRWPAASIARSSPPTTAASTTGPSPATRRWWSTRATRSRGVDAAHIYRL